MRVAIARLVLVVAVFAAPWAPAAAADVQRVVSPGGVEAWLIEDRMVPVLSLRMLFQGGAALDPPGREGTAGMAAALLDEGAGELDSQAFQKRLADLSISLGFSAGRDSFGGSLRTLTENRDEAFRLLATALTEARFDEEPVRRVRDQIRTGLARRAVDPGWIASRTLAELLFEGHPYARSADGTLESIDGIAVDDLRRFVSERLARDNLIVGVAGDISAEELAPLLDVAFGGLPASAGVFEVPEAVLANPGQTVVVERPVPQSVVLFAHGGIPREDPDWYAAQIVNHVLGGGSFSSRLMEEIREKRGLAYGVSTSVVPYDRASLVTGQVATQNARVAESVDLVRSEWRRLAEQGPSEEELADARTFLIGSFPISLDSTSAIAATLVAMQRYDLGRDHLDRRAGYFEAVTAEEARRVARRLLDPEALTFVVVGQPVGIEPTRAPPPDRPGPG
ncbi:MAG: M16 family metallopeptidase [Alphaproteobacteria bacterium]